MREANFRGVQEQSGKRRSSSRTVSRIPRAEEYGPKYVAPSRAALRTSSGRGNASFRSIRRSRYSLSSRKKMLKGGRCRLMRVFSRRRASFSVAVTMHRISRTRATRFGIAGRPSPPGTE